MRAENPHYPGAGRWSAKRSVDTLSVDRRVWPGRWPGPTKIVLFFLLLFTASTTSAQSIPQYPYSSLSNEGCVSCMDTVRVMMFKKIFDISLLMPEWKPVVDAHHIAALEGTVQPHSKDWIACHVSSVDYSGYHYTHDFGFDVLPDKGYEYLLARRIWTGEEEDAAEKGIAEPDTIQQTTMHVEWESGVAQGNKGNVCMEANRRGESCGFFSAGHQRGTQFWNWPTLGDWVHLEGQWIWDRGHPPARTEIHPIRFCAVRRHLPDQIDVDTAKMYATRIDIFANGDGGALFNNRSEVPDFVQPVRMGDKDYTFKVRPVLQRPTRSAKLLHRVQKQPGDNHPAALKIVPGEDEKGPFLEITAPWKGHEDTHVLARTVHTWWGELNGAPKDLRIQKITVDFENIRFRWRKDFFSRPEWRIFAEAGGKWLFLNEFLDCDDILYQKNANSFRKKWPLDQSVTFFVPEGEEFRVHMGGWEEDGIGRVFGHLLDPEAPCTPETKKKMHKHLLPATPFAFHGCLDDHIGEIQAMMKASMVTNGDQTFEMSSQGKRDKFDQCPGARGIQEDVFSLRFRIRVD